MYLLKAGTRRLLRKIFNTALENRSDIKHKAVKEWIVVGNGGGGANKNVNITYTTCNNTLRRFGSRVLVRFTWGLSIFRTL